MNDAEIISTAKSIVKKEQGYPSKKINEILNEDRNEIILKIDENNERIDGILEVILARVSQTDGDINQHIYTALAQLTKSRVENINLLVEIYKANVKLRVEKDKVANSKKPKNINITNKNSLNKFDLNKLEIEGDYEESNE